MTLQSGSFTSKVKNQDDLLHGVCSLFASPICQAEERKLFGLFLAFMVILIFILLNMFMSTFGETKNCINK